jgi:NADH dehydrogenase FAD-containing subunit
MGVGSGEGGTVVRGLRQAEVDVVLVDRHNYHLFTPLLYEVGTALLDPSEIALSGGKTKSEYPMTASGAVIGGGSHLSLLLASHDDRTLQVGL